MTQLSPKIPHPLAVEGELITFECPINFHGTICYTANLSIDQGSTQIQIPDTSLFADYIRLHGQARFFTNTLTGIAKLTIVGQVKGNLLIEIQLLDWQPIQSISDSFVLPHT